jgi:hypothetical protein
VPHYHSKNRRPSWLPDPTETWYVEVRLPSTSPGNAPVVYALGPLGRWGRAREVAEQWERRHGPLTTAVHEKLSHLRAGLSLGGARVSVLRSRR